MAFNPSDLKDRSLLPLYASLLIFIVASVFFYLQARSNAIADTLRRRGSLLTIFVLHEESKPVLTVAYLYNNETNLGAVFDIPANFAVVSGDRSRYVPVSSYFDPQNPYEYVRRIASLLYLTDNNPFYIAMDLHDFSFLVDLIGGVEAFVAVNSRMPYNGEQLMLPAGSLILDGAKAREYLLIANQTRSQPRREELRRRFVGSFVQQMSRRSTMLANPLIVEELHKKSVTNMNKDAMLEFWQTLQRLDRDSMVVQKVTGTTRTIDNQQFLFAHYEGRLIREMMAQVQNALANPQENVIAAWPRRIEIQNGTQINGLAQRTAQIYESLGYNVVRTSNAESGEVDYTTVIDFSGNLDAATRIGEVIRTNRVYSFGVHLGINDLDLVENIDVRIVLGRDFDGRYTQELVS
jgi:polyisoprenyl-teichoic acid--peptidoglycan teichoic acid transferase